MAIGDIPTDRIRSIEDVKAIMFGMAQDFIDFAGLASTGRKEGTARWNRQFSRIINLRDTYKDSFPGIIEATQEITASMNEPLKNLPEVGKEITTETTPTTEITLFDPESLAQLEAGLVPGETTSEQQRIFEELLKGSGETAQSLISSGERGGGEEAQQRLLQELLTGEKAQAQTAFTQEALQRNQALAQLIDAFQQIETGRTEKEEVRNVATGELLESFEAAGTRDIPPELLSRLSELSNQFQDIRTLDPSTLEAIQAGLGETVGTTKEALSGIARSRAGTGTTFSSRRRAEDVEAVRGLAKETAAGRTQALEQRQGAYLEELEKLLREFGALPEIELGERRKTFTT